MDAWSNYIPETSSLVSDYYSHLRDMQKGIHDRMTLDHYMGESTTITDYNCDGWHRQLTMPYTNDAIVAGAGTLHSYLNPFSSSYVDLIYENNDNFVPITFAGVLNYDIIPVTTTLPVSGSASADTVLMGNGTAQVRNNDFSYFFENPTLCAFDFTNYLTMSLPSGIWRVTLDTWQNGAHLIGQDAHYVATKAMYIIINGVQIAFNPTQKNVNLILDGTVTIRITVTYSFPTIETYFNFPTFGSLPGNQFGLTFATGWTSSTSGSIGLTIARI